VQGRLYGNYTSYQWYAFRFEANASSHMIRLYLNDNYLDTIPYTSSPDRIRIELAGLGGGLGYLDDVYLRRITADSTVEFTITTLVSVTFTDTRIETTTSTMTLTQTSTETTTLSTTYSVTSTATTTLTERTAIEQSMNLSIYAWALGATIAAVVFVVVLLLRRTNRVV